MSAPIALWNQGRGYLRDEIPPQQYNMWIRPLHAVEGKQNEPWMMTFPWKGSS